MIRLPVRSLLMGVCFTVAVSVPNFSLIVDAIGSTCVMVR